MVCLVLGQTRRCFLPRATAALNAWSCSAVHFWRSLELEPELEPELELELELEPASGGDEEDIANATITENRLQVCQTGLQNATLRLPRARAYLNE